MEQKEKEIARCCRTELKEDTETAEGVKNKVRAYVQIKITSFLLLWLLGRVFEIGLLEAAPPEVFLGKGVF